MRTLNPAFCLALWAFAFANICKAEDQKIWLFSATTQRGATNVWQIPISQIRNLPIWKAGAEEPPLSLGRAVALASAWAISKGASTNLYLENIRIHSLNPNAPDPSSPTAKYHFVYYYNIHFGGVSYFGHHISCVVLMDGTVVEPERPGKPSLKTYEDYDE